MVAAKQVQTNLKIEQIQLCKQYNINDNVLHGNLKRSYPEIEKS